MTTTITENISQLKWKGDVVDDVPVNRDMKEDTKAMIEFIITNKNNNTKLTFLDIPTARLAFNRLRYARNDGKLNVEMFRKKRDIYVKVI